MKLELNLTAIARTTIAAVTIAASVAVGAPPPAQAAIGDGTCNRGEFCAYKNTNHESLLLESKAKNTQKVDVEDDVVSSIKNRTTWKWVAVDGRRALPDRKRELAASTSWTSLGSDWDNKINHFDAKG